MPSYLLQHLCRYLHLHLHQLQCPGRGSVAGKRNSKLKHFPELSNGLQLQAGWAIGVLR